MVSCDRYPKFSVLPLLPMLQSRVSSSYTAGTSSYCAGNALYQHKAENARMGNDHTRDKNRCPFPQRRGISRMSSPDSEEGFCLSEGGIPRRWPFQVGYQGPSLIFIIFIIFRRRPLEGGCQEDRQNHSY